MLLLAGGYTRTAQWLMPVKVPIGQVKGRDSVDTYTANLSVSIGLFTLRQDSERMFTVCYPVALCTMMQPKKKDSTCESVD